MENIKLEEPISCHERRAPMSELIIEDLLRIIKEILDKQSAKFDLAARLSQTNDRVFGPDLTEKESDKKGEQRTEPINLLSKFQLVKDALSEVSRTEEMTTILLEKEINRLNEFI